MVARRAAAEAMIVPAPVVGVERRRPLVVEGAARPVVAARGLRLALIPSDTPADHLRHPHPVADLVEEEGRKTHRNNPGLLTRLEHIENNSCTTVKGGRQAFFTSWDRFPNKTLRNAVCKPDGRR